ncbi:MULTISPECIES: hypothetical protein [unclassified Streptomyces]|uniref:hypothetical protein n=1 Tax=unclassified Streptomyces TaxID=2593676 RepID=UPI002DDB8228|nr:hypothetical protein [Streptomyces sp. NBC_01445]WSE10178.1 hypothetical protein OG574_46855 [Streptomyces sp. NBC_01445]
MVRDRQEPSESGRLVLTAVPDEGDLGRALWAAREVLLHTAPLRLPHVWNCWGLSVRR